MSERVKWYRDPVWQFWGVVTTVVVAAVVFWLGREVKGLTVTILAETPLVSVASEAGGLDDLTVLYRGQPATDVVLVQVKIENTGNTEIRPEDFVRPLRYVFAPNATVVDASVLESVPENLGMEVAWQSNVATISPLLLNAAERAVVRFVLVYGLTEFGAGAKVNDISNGKSFSVDARIAGIKDINVVGTLSEGASPVWISFLGLVSKNRILIFFGLMTFVLIAIFTLRR